MLRYTDMTSGESTDIQIADLSEKWFFTNELPDGLLRFGNYFKVSHVVATLLNEAYVLGEDEYKETEQGYQCGDYIIERDVVRETATPRTLRYSKREKIIFPYRYENGILQKFAKGEFERLYPGATAYLNQFREKLEERKSDKNSKWYEYGRSQALSGLDCEKLLISTVITEEVAVNMLTRECIPYAGMFIVPRENNEGYTFEDAIRILRSEEFKQYVEDVGIHISGSSVRITSKDVEDYRF